MAQVSQLRGRIDSVDIFDSAFNPFAAWTTPFRVAFSSESYYATSHVPGTAAAPQHFAYAEMQKFSDDSLIGTCGTTPLYLYNGVVPQVDTSSPQCNLTRSWTK